MKVSLPAVGSWICRLLVAFQVGGAGITKFISPGWATRFAHYGYAGWFVKVVAVGEIVGAVLFLIPRTMTPGAFVLSAILLGAIYTQATHGELAQIARPLLPLLLIAIAWWLRALASRPRER